MDVGGNFSDLFLEETGVYNRIVLGTLLPSKAWVSLPHFFQSWSRNFLGGSFLYLISGFLWCFYIYYLRRNRYIPNVVVLYLLLSNCTILYADAIPSREAMQKQIGISMKAMPWYTLLPTVSEHMIESGWTKCFPRISDVGFLPYLGYLAIYLIMVEFGIYWMHRELHDIKPLYKYLHASHHIYNKQNTLSPFAGLAFHPIDGILQAIPHVISLFIIPVHFTTHIALLFIEGVWTANIHDCIHGKVWLVMGAGYHTIHHTTYRHNYGPYTIWMDWMFNTLRDPTEGDVAPK